MYDQGDLFLKPTKLSELFLCLISCLLCSDCQTLTRLVYSGCGSSEGQDVDQTALMRLTVSHNASCLSLMRLNPVVRIFPSDRNTALIGLVPSWTFSLTWSDNN